jgi:hypothetical protein
MSERHLNWNTDFVAALATADGIPGASEASLSKSFRNLKELDASRTAMPLDLLLGRFIKMSEAFQPFKLQFDNPVEALRLLKDVEAGKLVVSITRQEPGTLVYAVFVIGNLLERNKFFQRIQDNKPSWGTDAAPIKDRAIADAAVSVLGDMGHPCHVLLIRMRTTETMIAKTLLDLGFVFQEQTNGTD